MRWHLGDLPGWIAALATCAAIFGAFYAARQAKALFLVEQKRDDQRDIRELRGQAIQIAAWATPSFRIPELLSAVELSDSYVSAVVSNPSLQPIYDVVIGWHRSSHLFRTGAANVIPPGEKKVWVLPYSASDAIEYGMFAMERVEDRDRVVAERIANEIRILVTFTDIQGQRWRRDQRGHLNEYVGSQESEEVSQVSEGDE